jgi:hypothetical protein
MYIKTTLTDLIQSLADRHDSGVYPTKSATISYWVRLLNRGAQYCAEELANKTPVDLTTVDGTIALPDDVNKIDSVYSGTTKLSPINSQDKASASGLVYWVSGDYETGRYINTTSDMDITVTYQPYVAKMANDADVCPIQDGEAVVAYAYSKLRMAETDPLEDAADSMTECNGRIADMKSKMNINDGGVAFTIYGE